MSSHTDTLAAVYTAGERCAELQNGLLAEGASLNQLQAILEGAVGDTGHYVTLQPSIEGLRQVLASAGGASEELRLAIAGVHRQLGGSG